MLPGEPLNFFGIAGDYSKEMGEGRVKRVEFNGSSPPYNFHVAVMGGENGAGAFVNPESNEAKVVAISRKTGLLAATIQPYVERIQQALLKKEPVPERYAGLGVHLATTTMAKARAVLGLSDEWASKLSAASPHGRNALLTVSRRMVGSDAYTKFENNDVVLAVQGRPTCDLDEFAKLTATKDPVQVTVLRKEQVMRLEGVKTTEFLTTGADRVLSFAGMVLHAPHAEVYFLTEPDKLKDGGVYVAELKQGSPSLTSENADEQPHQKRGKIIYEVNNTPISCLDEFIDAVTKVGDGQYCSVTTNDYSKGESKLFNVRLDLEYWPTMLYTKGKDNEWTLKRIQHEKKQ